MLRFNTRAAPGSTGPYGLDKISQPGQWRTTLLREARDIAAISVRSDLIALWSAAQWAQLGDFIRLICHVMNNVLLSLRYCAKLGLNL